MTLLAMAVEVIEQATVLLTSGGFGLPGDVVAQHSFEGCDHFSHDGDDDDLECQTAVIESARTRLA